MPRCLIIGQGIAGAMLGWTLRQHGADVHIVHDPAGPASSPVAAGIVNPVTGKRYAKSWRFNEFSDFARQTYRAMEAEWKVKLWHDREIIRLLGSPEESNNWSARAAQPEFSDFIGEADDAGPWSKLLQPGFFLGRIRQAAQVDFNRLRNAFIQTMQQEDALQTGAVHLNALPEYTRQYDAVICCEGALAVQNPFFPNIPWQAVKGEGLLVDIPGLAPSAQLPMLKKDLVVASPGGAWEQLHWVGATYEWEFADHHPTPALREQLETGLSRMIKGPFNVKHHFAGIRPVVKDRRPLLGRSPVQPNIHIFNGFGSKGALLTPFWADHMARHLLHGSTLDPEADVNRFNSNGKTY